MKHEDPTTRSKERADPEESVGMGCPDVEGHHEGGEEFGPQVSGTSAGHPGRQIGSGPAQLRYNLGVRPSTRIPGTRVEDPSEVLIREFLKGNFEAAYQAAQEIQVAYHEALLEASQQRFKANFGGPMCDNCSGLKAGPGVLATCFQVKRCNFDSVREGTESLVQLRVLEQLASK